MSQYTFLVRRGQPRKGETEAARKIAQEEGVEYVTIRDPGNGLKSWFAGPNRGFPFDQWLSERVAKAMAKAGFAR